MRTKKILTAIFALGLAAAAARAQNLKSWDDKISGSGRWKVLSDFNNDAVLDKETGLVWERSPATATGNQPAQATACVTSQVGGRMGWRLPTIFELATLIDPSQALPALPLGHPFLTAPVNDVIWSSTSSDAVSGDGWLLHANNGAINLALKTTAARVWCVRGPGGSPHQY